MMPSFLMPCRPHCTHRKRHAAAWHSFWGEGRGCPQGQQDEGLRPRGAASWLPFLSTESCSPSWEVKCPLVRSHTVPAKRLPLGAGEAQEMLAKPLTFDEYKMVKIQHNKVKIQHNKVKRGKCFTEPRLRRRLQARGPHRSPPLHRCPCPPSLQQLHSGDAHLAVCTQPQLLPRSRPAGDQFQAVEFSCS